jgi:uncharacterized membrane protein (DUF2068 family)
MAPFASPSFPRPTGRAGLAEEASGAGVCAVTRGVPYHGSVLNRGAATAAGVRAVALFEAAKGALVVLAGFGLLALVHRDAQQVAESLVRHMHLNPARHYPRIFINAASRLTDHRLHLLAAGAFAYASVRLAEAYGLWRMRPWAEWLALLSTGLYMPIEAYELWHRPTLTRAAILFFNTLVLALLLYVRFRVPEEELRRRS